MIRAGGRGPSLRRAMAFSAIALGTIATASMLLFISLSTAIRRTLDADTEQLMVEERIADQIVSSAFEQQLGAYRYLQAPSAPLLDDFRARGHEAYAEIQNYLFLKMPLSSRLNVEAIKEAHEEYEVAAQHAFDLALDGDATAARGRIDGLTVRAATLERAVRGFITERQAQGRALRARQETALRRLQWATAAVALALAFATFLLVYRLRRRVMLPLDDLSTAVRQLADGADRVRVAPQRYREFQLLADSFDEMSDKIRASRDEIEARNGELTRTLEELQRAQQDLVQHEKLSAMGEMLAGLAHELNNPLAGILGFGECLQGELSESSDPLVREFADSLVVPLVGEAIRARDLVRNLLHFARQPTAQLERVHLADTVEVAVGLRRHMFAPQLTSIDVDVPDDLYVIAQSQKLEHAIMNLVNNALDALRDAPGGSRLSIRAHSDDGGAGAVLVVEDDGPGFQKPERAFDPFYTTKPVGAGTGLGLALVHRFVQEFGGTVAVENRRSGGARVTIRLRAAPSKLESDAAISRAAALPGPLFAVAELPPPPHTRQRVLVVDDESALREVQRRMLARLDVDVTLAATGADACAALLDSDFDVVVTDLRMPGAVSGADLIAWLSRERPSLAERTLIVTGDVASDTVAASLSVGTHRVLSKPFSRVDYLASVRAMLAAAPVVMDA